MILSLTEENPFKERKELVRVFYLSLSAQRLKIPAPWGPWPGLFVFIHLVLDLNRVFRFLGFLNMRYYFSLLCQIYSTFPLFYGEQHISGFFRIAVPCCDLPTEHLSLIVVPLTSCDNIFISLSRDGVYLLYIGSDCCVAPVHSPEWSMGTSLVSLDTQAHMRWVTANKPLPLPLQYTKHLLNR